MSIETPPAAEWFPEDLAPFGWNAARQDEWIESGHPTGGYPVPARVTRVDRGECDVASPHGPLRVLSDSQRTRTDTAPATGDWAIIEDDPELGLMVGGVLSRRTAMVRRDPGEETVEQVLVANVDIVGIVHAVDQSFSAARIERLLVLAYDSGAQPIVVLTKSDLKDPEPFVSQINELGVETVVSTSAIDGVGISELEAVLVGQTTVFVGLSGCGKSTLTNALLGDEVQDTGAVREVDAKGRHTTTSRELFVLPTGGVLIDTPGVRAIGLWDAWPAVHRVYADVFELAAGCRFNDCTHGEEPGCAVVAAVESQDLDARRLDRYRALMMELTALDEEIEERKRRQSRGRRRRPRKRRR